MKVTKNTIIGEVISKHPEAVDVFLRVGFFCFGCPRAQMETIGDGAKAHGFTAKQTSDLIRNLNNITKTKNRK